MWEKPARFFLFIHVPGGRKRKRTLPHGAKVALVVIEIERRRHTVGPFGDCAPVATIVVPIVGRCHAVRTAPNRPAVPRIIIPVAGRGHTVGSLGARSGMTPAIAPIISWCHAIRTLANRGCVSAIIRVVPGGCEAIGPTPQLPRVHKGNTHEKQQYQKHA